MAKKTHTKPAPAKIEKVAPRIVNIKQAAAHCGVAIPTFDYHVTRYPDMPVLRPKPGEKWKGGKVDLDELDKWRDATGLLKEKAKGEGNVANNQRTKFQADLLEIQLNERRGKILDRDQVIRETATNISLLAQLLDMMPMKVGKKLGLSKDVIKEMRVECDAIRDQFLANMKKARLAK